MIEIPGLGGHPIVDGRIHRYSRERRGRKDSWYVLHQEGDKVWGAYGDWKTGERVSVREGELSRTQIARTMELTNRTRQDDGRRATLIAELQWSDAAELGAWNWDHPYLCRKRVPGIGLRRNGSRLLVPMRELGGQLRGLQCIYPDGTKLFTKGCNKRGSFHTIPGDAAVVIAEGYATAASIHMATGMACLVAFDRTNLLPVAMAYRAVHPEAYLVIAADNDAQTAGNPGVTDATKAARAAKAKLVVADMRGAAGTDFNDIHLAHGLSEVARQVYGAL